MNLLNKCVVITGASDGIGRALAERLATHQTRLVLAARNRSKLDEVAIQCRALGASVIVVPTDVAVETDCKALIDAACSEFGEIDILVNNAGISMWALFQEVENLDFFHRIMQVNYMGAVYCTYYALPHLQNTGGLIVAVSSLTGKMGVPTRTGYSASKHAMQGFFDSLRVELRNTPVDVCVVSPGFVATDIRRHAVGADGSPRGESPRLEDKNTMSLDDCVDLIVRAIQKRQRELVMTAKARFGLWLRMIAPNFVDKLISKSLDEK